MRMTTVGGHEVDIQQSAFDALRAKLLGPLSFPGDDA